MPQQSPQWSKTLVIIAKYGSIPHRSLGVRTIETPSGPEKEIYMLFIYKIYDMVSMQVKLSTFWVY